jgi:hypothetical protein
MDHACNSHNLYVADHNLKVVVRDSFSSPEIYNSLISNALHSRRSFGTGLALYGACLEFNRGLSPQKGGNMAKTKPIKALLNLKKSTANDVINRGNAVLGGVFVDKDDYPNPPVDQATLKTELDALSTGITAALDGGKKAVAEREHQKEVVIKSLRQLGHYAEAACKDDMPTFLKSGFQPSPGTRTKAKPVSDSIRKITPGPNSGQMQVSILAQQGALSYQLRWAPLAAPGGTLANWTEQPVGKTKPAVLVTGLIPGTAYAFQVRAVTNAGYTDWSESVTRICT